MKRIAATAAILLALGSFRGIEAATLRPLDQDGLNLRAGPGTNHAIVAVLAPGQAATVLSRDGDWYKVRLAGGAEGWVAGWFSRVLYEDEERYAVVDTDVLNVRQQPGLTAGVLTRLVEGTQVRLLEALPEWWRIRLADGTEGWVAATYMKLAPTNAASPAPVTPPATPPTTPPATPPTTPPATPPTTPPTTPPAPGPVVPAAPPPAPPGTVPELLVVPSRGAQVLPGKTVTVRSETGVFAGPNSEARRVDTVRPGETLKMLDASAGWVRVETPRAKRGWIQGSLVQVQDGRLQVLLTERTWVLQSLQAQPASAATPAAAEDSRFRTVRDADGLNLRLIPTLQGQSLAVLPQGMLLEVLDTDNVWLKVKTPEGRVGWVHSSFTLPAGDPAQPAQPAPPPPPPVLTGEQFKLTADQPMAGASRLVLQTGGSKPLGTPSLMGSLLLIPFASGETDPRTVPLNLLGVRSATVSEGGILLDLVGQPVLKIEAESPGKLALLLRPALTGITRRAEGDRVVYHFAVSGLTLPAAREAGPNIIIEFPGALLPAPITHDGVKVVAHETGVRVAVATYRAFAMRQVPTGYELVIYPPGLAGKSIMLDPGHGGDDGGAVSRLLGVVEKEVNLQVALRLRALLEARGAKVTMTRATDRRAAPESFLASTEGEPRDQLDMQYRTLLANQHKVDLFLSLHHNAGDAVDQGTETFYSSGTLNGERSRAIARLIQDEVVAAIGTRSRGAKDDTFYVTRNTEAPSALLEIAFINHPKEGGRTKDADFQEAVAQAILRALERHFAERPW